MVKYGVRGRGLHRHRRAAGLERAIRRVLVHDHVNPVDGAIDPDRLWASAIGHIAIQVGEKRFSECAVGGN
jgi:hypothetical protein